MGGADTREVVGARSGFTSSTSSSSWSLSCMPGGRNKAGGERVVVVSPSGLTVRVLQYSETSGETQNNHQAE